MSLENIKVACSPLTGELYIARFGKKLGVASDKKLAEAEIITAVVEHVMFKSPKGAIKTITLGGKKYEITVKPIK